MWGTHVSGRAGGADLHERRHQLVDRREQRRGQAVEVVKEKLDFNSGGWCRLRRTRTAR